MLALRKFRKFIPTVSGLRKLLIRRFTFKTWLFFVVSFFIIGIGIYLLMNSSKGASANWWDDSFQYRKSINITVGSTQSDITNLETLFTIDTDDLVTSGKLQSDCDDLRFTAVNGNPLPYYIDSGCNGNSTKVWIMADKVPANTTTYTVYMYYGNSSAIAGSNGTTFFKQRGLAGYWTLNEGVGTSLADSSGIGNTGTFGAGGSAPSWGTGQLSTGLTFDGTDDYVNLGDIATTNFGTSDFTVSTWIKTSWTGGARYAISKRVSCNASADAWNLFVTASGVVQFELFEAGPVNQNYVNTVSAVNDGLWHHVVYVRINETVYGYFDGELQVTDPGAGTTDISNTASLQFGENPCNGTAAFPGMLDDVRIYTRALSGEEVVSLYNSPGSIASSAFGTVIPSTSFGTEEVAVGPAAYFRFNEGVGGTVNDSTQNNNDGNFGTGTSSPTWVTEDQCINGKCLRFDGTDDVVNLGSNTNLLRNVTKSTVSTWIKYAPIGNSYRILDISYGGSSASRLEVSIQTTGAIAVNARSTDGETAQSVTTTTTINPSKWYFLTIYIDYANDSINIYVNGELQNTTGTVNFGGSSTSDTSPLLARIGRDAASASHFSGYIDELKIYNYGRSAEQIKQDYASRGSVHGVSAEFGDADLGRKLSTGLVGYWKMDEVGVSGSSWTAIDSSGNNNSGTGAGNASVGTTQPGKFGNGGFFDGNGDYLTMGTNSILNPAVMTISAWVKPVSGYESEPRIIASRGTAFDDINVDWQLFTTNTQGYPQMNFHSNTGSIVSVTDDTALPAGSWTHLVGIYDGKTAYLYVNGKLENTTVTTITRNNTAGSVDIGRVSGDGSYPYIGSIDELRIYNRAFTPNEVSILYNFAAGPVAYYDFNENTGTTLIDKSGNGYTGNLGAGSSAPNWDRGKYGSSLIFDGSDDRVDIGTSTATISGTPTITGDQITVSAWVKSSNDFAFAGIVGKASNSNWTDGFGLFTNNDGTSARFYINSWNTNVAIGNTLVQNDWNFLVGTYDGATIRIYVNGKEGISDTLTGNITDAGLLQIGTIGNYTTEFEGNIDDVRIYDYVRTSKQIIEDMNAGHPAPGSPVGSATAYYRLDEGYGTTINNAGNAGIGLTGTFGTGNSAPTWSNNGKFGKALSFDGSSDQVRTGDSFDPNSNDFSISAWVNQALSSGDRIIMSKDTSGDPNSQFRLGTTNSGRVFFIISDSTNSDALYSATYTLMTPSAITLNQWTHVVVTRVGVNYSLYINGLLTDIASSATIIDHNTSTDLRIGSQPSAVRNTTEWKGLIDEVKLYNLAFTADQVKVEYNQGKAQVMGAGSTGIGGTGSSFSAGQEYCVPGDASTCNSPVGEWKMDEGVGGTANDTSGNSIKGNFATGNSAPTWIKGKNGSGLSFNNSYVDLGLSTVGSRLNGVSVVTASTWFKSVSFPANGARDRFLSVSLDTGSTSGVFFGIFDDSGVIEFGGRSQGSDSFQSGTVPFNTLGEWHFATGVIDYGSDIIKIYLDGQLKTTKSVTFGASSFTLGTPTFNDALGLMPGHGDEFNGYLDNVRIYTYERTPAQIAWEYNQGKPVGWYRLDECQGSTVYNASKDGNGRAAGNNGTITIGATGTQTAAGTCSSGNSAHAWNNGTTGKRGASLYFDGTDDYVSMGNPASLDFVENSTISMTAWVNVNTFPSSDFRMIVSKGQASTIEPYFIRLSSTNLQVGSWDGTNHLAEWTRTGWNVGEWHHITGLYDGAVWRLYFDAKEVSSNVTDGPEDNSRNFVIGARDNNGTPTRFFDGKIDDVRIFNYPLTPAQIKTVMNDGAVSFR